MTTYSFFPMDGELELLLPNLRAKYGPRDEQACPVESGVRRLGLSTFESLHTSSIMTFLGSEGREANECVLIAALDGPSVGREVFRQVGISEASAAEPRSCVIDAIGGSVIQDGARTETLSAESLRGIFSKRWGVLVIAAHGEGSHAQLATDAVLCGLVEEAETICGTVSAGGCRRGVCKRSPDGSKIFYAQDVECDTLVLMSCFGVSVAGAGYPSDVSLVRAFLKHSPPRSIISTFRGVEVGEEMWRDLDSALDGSRDLGSAIGMLNVNQRAVGSLPRFVGLGLPNAPIPFVDFGSLVSKSEANSRERDTAVEILPLVQAFDSVSRAMSAKLLRHSTDRDSALAAAHAISAERASRDRLLNTLLVAASLTGPTSDVAMNGAASAWLDSAWRAVGESKALKQLEAIIKDATTPSGPEFEHGKCVRCQTALEVRPLRGIMGGASGEQHECPVCGVISCWIGSRAVELEVGTAKFADGLSRSFVVSGLSATETMVMVDVQHKGTGNSVLQRQLTLPGGDASVEVAFDESRLSFDLHTVRARWLSRLGVGIERQRFAHLPSGVGSDA